jgi:hypothetical protein
MTLPEILKQFDELFEEYGAKQAFTQTYTSMVEEEIARLEGEIKKADKFVPFQRIHYVSAIEDQLNYWKNKLK